jgi:hypothetical protein
MKLNPVILLLAVAPLAFTGCNSDSTAGRQKAATQNASAAQQI